MGPTTRRRQPSIRLAPHAACAPALALLALAALVAPVALPARAAPLQEATAIPTPEAWFGHAAGERHVRHDRLVAYFERVAERSDRVRVERIGETHEGRPLIVAIVTAPERLGDLEAARRARLDAVDPEAAPGPGVVWLGYSVHGNEASGSNAAPWVLHRLAMSDDPEVAAWLRDLVVLIDPSLNPDGLGRFTSWVNANRSARPVADRAAREHREPWPGGRTNHYLFDLNRDWLPLVHPESRARVGVFRRWMPNVVADFHEMGPDSTYFFQPGVPTRTNPLTPERNVELTQRIATYHAAALDAVGQPYFTEEIFDDFYYGKGSTYPDVQGAVGILFEQASVRGHRIESDQGTRTFARAVRNQRLASFSTLRGAHALRDELERHRREFRRLAREEGARGAVRGWVFGGAGGDRGRARALIDVLLAHGVEVRPATQDVATDGAEFGAGAAWVVPAAQAQGRLARAVFETRTDFADETFYDVSAWTLPHAYDLTFAPLDAATLAAAAPGAPLAEPPAPPTGAVDGPAGVGYAFDWSAEGAPRATAALLADGLRLRVATAPFSGECGTGLRAFERGTILVPAGLQELEPEPLRARVERAAAEEGLDICALAGGLTPRGPDLGSPGNRPLTAPRPLLPMGDGVHPYEAGELWHLADLRLDVPVVPVDPRRVPRLDLSDYTHLLLVSGRYPWSEEETARIADWVRAGGTILATRGAAAWVERAGLGEFGLVDEGEDRGGDSAEDADDAAKAAGGGGERMPPEARRPFADLDADRARDRVSGAIVAAELDRTHPLAYGFARDRIALFRRGTERLEVADDPYATFALYADEPLLAGYMAPANRAKLAGSAAGRAARVGRGSVIVLADDPAFRGFWRGTERLWINGLFFADLVRNGESRGSD